MYWMRVLPCAAALHEWRRKSWSRPMSHHLPTEPRAPSEGVDLLAELSDLRRVIIELPDRAICVCQWQPSVWSCARTLRTSIAAVSVWSVARSADACSTRPLAPATLAEPDRRRIV